MKTTEQLIEKFNKNNEYYKNYRKNNREKLNESSARCMAKKRFTNFGQIKCRKIMRQNGYDLTDILYKTGFRDGRMSKENHDLLYNFDIDMEIKNGNMSCAD
jgi:hypothetical protein